MCCWEQNLCVCEELESMYVFFLASLQNSSRALPNAWLFKRICIFMYDLYVSVGNVLQHSKTTSGINKSKIYFVNDFHCLTSGRLVFYAPFVNWADLWLPLSTIVIIKNMDSDKLKTSNLLLSAKLACILLYTVLQMGSCSEHTMSRRKWDIPRAINFSTRELGRSLQCYLVSMFI